MRPGEARGRLTLQMAYLVSSGTFWLQARRQIRFHHSTKQQNTTISTSLWTKKTAAKCLQKMTKVIRKPMGHMSWPPASCCFQVVTAFHGDFWYYKMDGWVGGRGGEGRGRARCKYYFLWIIRVHIQLLPFENCLPRCRFQILHVVASLSQQVTKLAWLHVFLLLKISPFVVCTLQYIPDSTVTGTLKPQGRGLLYERGGDARRLS